MTKVFARGLQHNHAPFLRYTQIRAFQDPVYSKFVSPGLKLVRLSSRILILRQSGFFWSHFTGYIDRQPSKNPEKPEIILLRVSLFLETTQRHR